LDVSFHSWIFLPGTPVEQTVIPWAERIALFVKIWNVGCFALITNRPEPIGIGGSPPGPGLTTINNPLEVWEIGSEVKWTQKRFTREPSDLCRDTEEWRYPIISKSLVFYGDAEPYMWWGWQTARADDMGHSMWPFGEYLVDVPVGSAHDMPDHCKVIGRYIPVEEVGHRVDKDKGWFPPFHRLIEPVGAEGDLKAFGIYLL